MGRRSLYLFMAVAGLIMLFGSVVVLIYFMLADPFGKNGGSGIMISIFLFMAMLLASIGLMTVGFLRYFNKKTFLGFGSVPMRICPECGTEMEATELTCPKCYAIPPVEDRSRRK